MKFKQLCFILQTQSPDTILEGMPLIYWVLKKPECIALLLNNGANPNICCHVHEDLSATPLYLVSHGLRVSKRMSKRNLVQEILEWWGAESTRYSDFYIVDIAARNEILL
jgi:hypothetical protein|tara:strand:+ start:1505 stop:1834 length:330 start_codon:yes stop_codon:yes gene_type:complete